MKLLFHLCFSSAAALLLVGCASDRLQPYSETVMTPGMRIRATNAAGTVIITAKQGTARHYEGDGWSKTSTLIARQGRWNGSLGLYDPADSFSPYGRLLLEEGRIYCKSTSEAMRYLYTGSDRYRWVYTNSGLVFGYDIIKPPAGDTGAPVRDIAVWQIYINGRRPHHLPGADDRAIHVESGTIPDVSTPHHVEVGESMLFGKKEYVPTSGH